MARPKRSSIVLDKATRRIAGMRSISTILEFGNGLSLADYDTRIQVLQTQLSSYNTMLSDIDKMAGQVALLEQELRTYSEKMLMSVATRYGKDSLQYVQAGGRLRKRMTRLPVGATSTTTPATTASLEKMEMNGSGTKTAVN